MQLRDEKYAFFRSPFYKYRFIFVREISLPTSVKQAHLTDGTINQKNLVLQKWNHKKLFKIINKQRRRGTTVFFALLQTTVATMRDRSMHNKGGLKIVRDFYGTKIHTNFATENKKKKEA